MAGITSTKKIKGQPHLLAYITPNEVKKLKALGGQETMTKEGIPAYPEYDNYGYSSQADFDAGDVSKSNDPNVRGEGPGQNRVTAAQLAAINAKEKAKEKQKIIDEMLVTPIGRNKRLSKIGLYNANFQRQKNLDLARKRAFQKYKDLEKYVHGDFDMDYDFTQDIYGNKTPIGLEFLTSNKGTPIESKRKNLYDVNPTTSYSMIQALVDKTRPNTQVTLENTLNKARAYNQLVLDSPNLTNQDIRDQLTNLKNRGKTPDQINPPDNNGGDPYLFPIDYNTGAAITEVVEPYTNDFDYRFGTGQNIGADVTKGSYIFNQGGRVPRNMGGIMNAVPRQGYFLGGIGRAVGKVVGGVAKAAGKVLKSDLGKAALAGAAFYYGGGGRMPFTEAFKSKGFGGAKLFGQGSFFSKANPLLFSEGAFNPLKFAGLITAGGALAGPAKVDQMPGDDGRRGGRLLDSRGNEVLPAGIRDEINEAYESGDVGRIKEIESYYAFLPPRNQYLPYPNYAVGGRVAAQEGGLMDLGGMEKDYRAEGGFVPIGREEKADDVPARLSVNEFVFTADAVRNAGGGDIDKGAEVMENMMKNLENGGRVSEESQGNTGAQEMFSVSERIGEVI